MLPAVAHRLQWFSRLVISNGYPVGNPVVLRARVKDR
jgi:hypothetical protein